MLVLPNGPFFFYFTTKINVISYLTSFAFCCWNYHNYTCVKFDRSVILEEKIQNLQSLFFQCSLIVLWFREKNLEFAKFYWMGLTLLTIKLGFSGYTSNNNIYISDCDHWTNGKLECCSAHSKRRSLGHGERVGSRKTNGVSKPNHLGTWTNSATEGLIAWHWRH